MRHAFGEPLGGRGRAEAARRSNGTETETENDDDGVGCVDAGRIVLSLSGGVLHASATALRLLGRPSAALRAELRVFPFDGCCWAELAGADGGALEAHAVRGEWRGAPAWVGMLSRVRRGARRCLDLELALAAARRANLDLERLAVLDPLTSLLNRRGLAAALVREAARQDRSGEPLAAVMIDCDDFKRVNDDRGHSVGDQVLQQVARRLRGSLRPSDYLGRVGGDEFLVLLPNTGAEEALRVGRRLRQAVAESPLREPEGAVGLTVSLGLALLPHREVTLEGVLASADAWLRRSKRRGKNRLSAAGVEART